MDKRIGGRFLNAGLGFGGSCFKKDILSLVYLCREFGADSEAEYWESVVRINEHQKERFVQRMVRAMFGTLAEKKIGIFGFAFKPDTGDIREAPAIDVVKRLLDEGAHPVISDPRALDNAKKTFGESRQWISYQEDPYRAAEGCHAIAVVTEWDLYKTLDYEKIYNSMEKPAFFFDGRNIIDHRKLYEIGFNVYTAGRPPLVHF